MNNWILCEYLNERGSEWMIGLIRKGVNNWVSERILSKGMSGRVSQWVRDEMREQSSEQTRMCDIMRVTEIMN